MYIFHLMQRLKRSWKIHKWSFVAINTDITSKIKTENSISWILESWKSFLSLESTIDSLFFICRTLIINIFNKASLIRVRIQEKIQICLKLLQELFNCFIRIEYLPNCDILKCNTNITSFDSLFHQSIAWNWRLS